MNEIDFDNSNNFTISESIFDLIAHWQLKKQPNQSLQSFLGEIEKILDKIEQRGYNKGRHASVYYGNKHWDS